MFGAKEERKTIGFDTYEEGAVIKGLNKIRTEKLKNNECADYVNKLMLKIIQTPSKKARVRRVPTKYQGDFVGRGGATEQASFSSRKTETSKQSPRRRDEAR